MADVRPSAATRLARGPFTFIKFEASSLRFCLCIIAHFDLLHVICVDNLKYAYGTKECSGNYRQQKNVGMEFKLRTLYKHMLSIWFPQLNPPKARIGVWRDIYGRKRRAFGNDLQTGARSSILTMRVKYLLTVESRFSVLLHWTLNRLKIGQFQATSDLKSRALCSISAILLTWNFAWTTWVLVFAGSERGINIKSARWWIMLQPWTLGGGDSVRLAGNFLKSRMADASDLL